MKIDKNGLSLSRKEAIDLSGALINKGMQMYMLARDALRNNPDDQEMLDVLVYSITFLHPAESFLKALPNADKSEILQELLDNMQRIKKSAKE